MKCHCNHFLLILLCLMCFSFVFMTFKIQPSLSSAAHSLHTCYFSILSIWLRVGFLCIPAPRTSKVSQMNRCSLFIWGLYLARVLGSGDLRSCFSLLTKDFSFASCILYLPTKLIYSRMGFNNWCDINQSWPNNLPKLKNEVVDEGIQGTPDLWLVN